MKSNPPVVRDVVLLGGGHSHVIVIRLWAMTPIPGIRLTLVSQDAMTPYSGMLPGLVAGHYSYTDSHIDLNRLCRWAGVRFIRATVTGLAPDQSRVLLEGRPAIEYDIVSIDTGGAPNLDTVEGARRYTTPVKPVHQFWSRWQEIELRACESAAPMRIGVVGGGAGGFEILLAMQHRLGIRDPGKKHSFHWVYRSEMLSGSTDRVRKMATAACLKGGIALHPRFDVIRVERDALVSRDGDRLALDEFLWCTEATAALWPAISGLDCDERGFITIDDCLRSTSHNNVFAAGDVAIQINHPRPRAGVFAVRQGPALFSSLQRAAVDQNPRPHRPQKHFLTLLSLGGKSAIAQRGMFSVQGDWVWRWKDWIDRRFMDRFNMLPRQPQMTSGQLPDALSRQLAIDPEQMRCGGCGAKVGGDILGDVLDGLSIVQRDDVARGLTSRDDVTIIQPGDRLLAQSVDQIRGLVDDPWQFARIATLHALSDLYASSAVPQSAMAMLGLPFAHDNVVRRELTQILEGVVATLNESGCVLTGGHTSEAAELTIGLVVNGYLDTGVSPGGQVTPGQYELVLTKPLGTGVIMAADMRGLARWSMVEDCLQTMLQSNRQAGECLAKDALLVTDVTGFGLIGHLGSMIRQVPGVAEIQLDALPLLDGALALSSSGIRSTLHAANLRSGQLSISDESQSGNPHDHPVYPLLFDPQTSGGLLAMVPVGRTLACIETLRAAGYRQAARIGGMMVRAGTHNERGAIHVG